MKIKQLLILILIILLCITIVEIRMKEIEDVMEEMVDIKEDKAEIANIEEIISSFPIIESKVEKEKIVSKIDWEDNREEHMYVVEQEPERLKQLIKGIAEHPELSAAEKEFSISTIRYSNSCPLECLDGYSKYKKEFEEKHPSGIDPETNHTFKELVDYHASLGERVREELKKDKREEFFMN